jgi:cell division septal protein FtsQ
MSKRHRSPGITRVEAGAQARRRRAMAHLERVRNQHQRRGPSVRAAIAGVATLSVVAGLIAGATGWFASPVAEIWVVGASWVPADEIARAAGVPLGTEPGAVDRAAVADRIATNAWVTSARVLLLPGGNLLVGVRERQPAALLAGETPWAVDADGVAFAPAPTEGTEGLLVLTAAERPELGEADPGLAQALALAQSLPELGLPVPEQVAIAAADDPEGLSLVLPGVTARVVLGREDLDTRLGDLARLLEAGLPELEGATRIDLRFEDQAVFDRGPSLDGAEQAAAPRGDAAPSNSRRAG